MVITEEEEKIACFHGRNEKMKERKFSAIYTLITNALTKS